MPYPALSGTKFVSL